MSTEPDVASEGAAMEGEVRTYRGRTVEELIPRIRAELGPGAIILRERTGLTGGVGGFFAQRCVEIEAKAAPRVSVLAGDEGDAFEAVPPPPAAAVAPLAEVTPAEVAPAVVAPVAESANAELGFEDDEELELDDAAFAAASVPTFAARLQAAGGDAPPAVEPRRPETRTADPEPRTAPVAESGRFRSRAAAQAPAAAAAATKVPTDGFIAFDELDEVAAAPAAPKTFRASASATKVSSHDSKVAVEIPIPVWMDTPVAPEAPEAREARKVPAAPEVPEALEALEPLAPVEPAEAPAAEPAPSPFTRPASDPAIVIDRLIENGLSPAFAEALVVDAHDRDAQADSEPRLLAAVGARLAEMLPTPAALPLAGGAIAVVGPGGSGKTRAVAGLATALARAGHTVSVARLGSPERALELAELLRDEPVEVLPAMRTRATARAVASARERGLVIVDTTAARSGDHAAVEVLSETLAPFALDGVLLTVPATYTARAADRLAAGYAPLHPTGLIVTRLDESEDLGAIAELSVRHGIPADHGHTGADVAHAITALDADAIAETVIR